MRTISNYSKVVVEILLKNGYMYSSDLIVRVQEEVNVNHQYAKKIIQRVYDKGLICSSKPVIFKYRQQIFYLMNDLVCSRLISSVNFSTIERFKMRGEKLERVAKVLKSINIIDQYGFPISNEWDINGVMGNGVKVNVLCINSSVDKKVVGLFEKDNTNAIKVLVYKNKITKEYKKYLSEKGVITFKFDDLLIFGRKSKVLV